MLPASLYVALGSIAQLGGPLRFHQIVFRHNLCPALRNAVVNSILKFEYKDYRYMWS